MKVLAVACSLFVGLLLGEGLLRLFWYNPYRLEEPDRLVVLRMQHPQTDRTFDRANIDAENPRVRFRTDARCYIRPSVQHEEPDATVAFLGGSTTECSAVAEDARFAALTSQLLGEQGIKVNTLNAGRSGNTLHDSINVLFNHVIADRPDIVVLMHATNDTGVLRRDPNYHTRMGDAVSASKLAKWSLQIASSYSYLTALVRQSATATTLEPRDGERIRWRGDPAHAEEVPVEPFRQRLLTFVAMCRSFGIVPVLMTQPLSVTTNELTPEWADLGAQDRFNEVIRKTGKEQDVLVIDLALHLKRHVADWDKPLNVFYDGMHVTDRGSRIYARQIAAELLPIVRELRDRGAR